MGAGIFRSRTTEATEGPRLAPGPLGAGSAPRRILLADDDKDGAAALAALLAVAGHLSEHAYDGPEAVDVAANFEPHLVMLSIGLQKIDGYEVCRRMRAAPWGKSMTIIAVTGLDDEAHRARALKAGFDMRLTRPVSEEVFLTVLAAVF
jgi:DNA-binding response OmpR family regulator